MLPGIAGVVAGAAPAVAGPATKAVAEEDVPPAVVLVTATPEPTVKGSIDVVPAFRARLPVAGAEAGAAVDSGIEGQGCSGARVGLVRGTLLCGHMRQGDVTPHAVQPCPIVGGPGAAPLQPPEPRPIKVLENQRRP